MYKVIVVEDETVARRGIILTTGWEGLNCMIVGEASDGEEGISLITRLNPDIVVTDVKMPRLDGVEMIARLREGGCSSKFILLTAYNDFKYAQSALRLGVSDYLIKPLQDGELEEAVIRVCGQLKEHEKSQEEGRELPILQFYPERSVRSKYVEQAIGFIRSHYREDITISTVAGDLEISEGYLSRVFKKETDYTFTNYLIYYRIQMAANLLRDCRVKVYEVADRVGYSDTNYFSAQFKKIVGVSPSEYQDRCR